MFLLFTGQRYYPSGGAQDFHSSDDYLFRLVEEAKKISKNNNGYGDPEWWHIFCTDSLKIVAGSNQQAYQARGLALEKTKDLNENEIIVVGWCLEEI